MHRAESSAKPEVSVFPSGAACEPILPSARRCAAPDPALLFQSQQNIDIGLIPLILAVVALVIHIAFAVGVFKDSARR